MPLTKNTLTEMVFENFSSKCRPIISLETAEARDCYLYHRDPDEYKRIESRKITYPWHEVPRVEIQKFGCSECHLDSSSGLYYLPTFIMDFIENYEEDAEGITMSSHHEYFIYGLEKPKYFQMLNDSQKQTIYEFLSYSKSISSYLIEDINKCMATYHDFTSI